MILHSTKQILLEINMISFETHSYSWMSMDTPMHTCTHISTDIQMFQKEINIVMYKTLCLKHTNVLYTTKFYFS
jgi:kynurenine formamidase